MTDGPRVPDPSMKREQAEARAEAPDSVEGLKEAQQNDPVHSTNPEEASMQLSSMADLLSQEQMQAIDQLAQRYGEMASPQQDSPPEPLTPTPPVQSGSSGDALAAECLRGPRAPGMENPRPDKRERTRASRTGSRAHATPRGKPAPTG